jgi:hypothetical protein
MADAVEGWPLGKTVVNQGLATGWMEKAERLNRSNGQEG